MMRIGIVGLIQESNTFLAEKTQRHHFEEDLLLRGEAIREKMAHVQHEVGGFFEVLDSAGVEVVPIFVARALPFGRIEREVFATLVEEMLQALVEAGPLDGILAAPHGATVAEGWEDADGYWLSRVREQGGREIPIVATLDPHTNLSPEMIAATDALTAYRTNPHLDQRETGKRAAKLLLRALAGEVSLAQAASCPPMAMNIRLQNTSQEPMAGFYREAQTIAEKAGVLDHSILLGFPYADVVEMGSSVIVITDGDRELAQKTADQIAAQMWERRRDFEPEQLDAATAVSLAAQSALHPVVFLDMGDNVGGGSPADSTVLVHEWLKAGSPGRLFLCLCDPTAAARATELGAGAILDAAVGDLAAPVNASWRIRSLHEGKFFESKARHGGFSEFDQGPTAILESLDEQGKGVVVMATTRRMVPFSLAQLSSCGIDPFEFDAIVAKGVIAPMAAYEEVAKGGFLHIDTPGPTRADMTKLTYTKRRRPMFPFEAI